MNKYQKAAKLLNEQAPVDGEFGQERIAYLNPLEEQILKSIGGSGATIIPGVEEQGESMSLPRRTRQALGISDLEIFVLDEFAATRRYLRHLPHLVVLVSF